MNFKLVPNNDNNSFFSIKKGSKNTPVSLLENKGGSDEIEGEIVITPNTNDDRDVVFVTAQSGAGKSFWIVDYALQYRIKYPKNSIYLISAIDKNEKSTIDKIKKLKKIDINNELFLESIDIEELKNSLVIFDDVDNLKKGYIRNAVWDLMTDILKTGRHYRISAIVSYHNMSDGAATRSILNECNKIVVFPSVSTSLKYLFEKYLGISNKDTKKIMNLDTRSVCITKTYPKCVLYKNGAFILRPNF
jgi:hypothetical protein